MTSKSSKIPYKPGPGFVTSYLPDFPGDWECVLDFCGRCAGIYPFNVCAWYSKTRNVTSFGGIWWEVPDLPYRASEDAAWKHGMAHSTVGKRIAAQKRAEAAWEARCEQYDKTFAKLGVNTCRVVLRKPDGTTEVVEGPVGMRGTLTMLRHVTEALPLTGRRGYVIVSLKVTNSKGNDTRYDLKL